MTARALTSITCVMPAYNEAPCLGRVVPEVLDALRALAPQVELILVDDGSRDTTAAVARRLVASHPELVYLQLSRNFGKEAALTAGIDAAAGAVVVLMDADGQHPTSLLPEMMARWQQGADVVYAVRATRDDQSGLHARLTGLFYKLLNWRSRVKIPADAGDFRWMDRRVVDALKALPERNRFMKGLYAWVGFQGVALPYEPLARTEGDTKFGLFGAMRLALVGMLAFSTLPLRMMTLLGALLASGALVYAAWVVIEYFGYGIDVPGYATIVVGMLFLSGVQLLSIGMLAEYVGRIYEEVKLRPTYLLRERHGQGLASRTDSPSP